MIELRQHQQEANTASCDAFEAGKTRITLEMATGTGKSFTQAALLADRFEKGDTDIVAFVPSQDLVAQNALSYRKYLKEQGIDVNVIGIFSPQEDLMREGCDVVTTSADDVIGVDKSKPTVYLATYASAKTVEEACQKGLGINTMICDEAHRMASGSTVEESGVWSLPLFDDKIPAERRAFYTATLRAEDRDDVITMSNAELFGERVYELGYKEAVERGILEQYEPFPVSVERAQIEAAMSEAGIEREDGMSDAAWRNQERAFAAALMSDSALEKRRAAGEPLSMMTLHPNRQIAAIYNGVLEERFEQKQETLPAMVVHGAATEQKERALAIGRSLKGEMAVSVVDMFREGTDMPGLNTLVVARNSSSSILLVQAMGRVVRKYSHDWVDENGQTPVKRPHIYVPVIVDSRDPQDKPDCALAAQLFSAMLRADNGAREQFEQASMMEGRKAVFGEKEGKETEATDTAAFIAQKFGLDIEGVSTRALAEEIAQATRVNDSIGHFERKAGEYEAWLETNGYEQPSLPGKAEWKAAQTPEQKAKLEQRRELVNWHSAVLTKHAERRLYPEQAKRLYDIKGFSFKEAETAPEKLVKHFEAYEMYANKAPQEASLRPWATVEGRLARLVKEAAQVGLEGQRVDGRGKPLPRQKGDAALEQFAQQLSMRQAIRGQVPSILDIKEPMSIRGSIDVLECPDSGRKQLCIVPAKGERIDSRRAIKFQPMIPLEVSTTEQERLMTIRGKDAVFSIEPGKRGVRANIELRVADEMNPEWAGFVDIVRKQPMGASFSNEHLSKNGQGRPVGALDVPGWSNKTNNDLAKMAQRARRQHASGELDLKVIKALDQTAGFSWVENEDYGARVKQGKHDVLQPQAAFEVLYKRHKSRLLEPGLMGQDSGVANTVKAGRALIERARAARAQAVAYGNDKAGKAQMMMWQKATQLMKPAMPAFREWATWEDPAVTIEDKQMVSPRRVAQAR